MVGVGRDGVQVVTYLDALFVVAGIFGLLLTVAWVVGSLLAWWIDETEDGHE